MGNENKTIIKNSAIISLLVLIGKLLGFVKQSVQAWAFGTTSLTDAYLSADSYISMIGAILSSSIAPVIITQYIKVKNEKDEDEAKRFVKTCLAIFVGIAVFFIAINYIFSDEVAIFLGRSYNKDQLTLLSRYLRMLLPVILFGSIIGTCSGYLQGEKVFWPTQLLSLFFSVSIIVSILLFKEVAGIKSVIYGFIGGYILYCLNLLLHTRKVLITTSWTSLKSDEVKELFRKLFPVVISTSVVDLGHLADKIIASSLGTGSVTYLYYGQVICGDLVNSIVVISLTTVLLPTLTENAIAGRISKVRDIITRAITTVSFVLGIITVLYVVEGYDLIQLVFQRGGFNATSTENVNLVSIGYAVGLVFMAASGILTKAHYAFQDTFHPMLINSLGIILNVFLSIALSGSFGVMGISLATSISYVFTVIILYISIRKYVYVDNSWKNHVIELMKTLFCIVLALFAGLLVHNRLINVVFYLKLVIVSAAICIVYIGVACVVRTDSISYLIGLIGTRSKQ